MKTSEFVENELSEIGKLSKELKKYEDCRDVLLEDEIKMKSITVEIPYRGQREINVTDDKLRLKILRETLNWVMQEIVEYTDVIRERSQSIVETCIANNEINKR